MFCRGKFGLRWIQRDAAVNAKKTLLILPACSKRILICGKGYQPKFCPVWSEILKERIDLNSEQQMIEKPLNHNVEGINMPPGGFEPPF